MLRTSIILLLATASATESKLEEMKAELQRDLQGLAQTETKAGTQIILDENGDPWPERKPTPHQSDRMFDFLGQIPDMVIAKNSRAKIEIPDWFTNYPKQNFAVECEEINYKGEQTLGSCPGVEVFIDQDNIMWIEPARGYTGRIRVTLESTNVNGDRDQTCFDVIVVEHDNDCDYYTQDCSCLAETESESQGWLRPKIQKRGRQCYGKPQVYLVHDQYFRFWIVDRSGKRNQVVWLDFTEQYAWVDSSGTAHIWPSASEVPQFSGYGREAIAYYEPSRHTMWDYENAVERGFRPRGSVRITQESPRHKAVLTWKVENLRPYCWTEGHVHYNGDRHETLLKEYAEHENVHLNYY